MSDVIPLFGGKPAPALADPAPELIAWLEEKLERVRKGEIIGIAGAAVLANGGLSTGWECGQASLPAMIGAIARLQHAFHVGTDEANEK